MRVPNQILANWLHGHALDEYAIGYDAITVVRLIVVLEMMDKTDDLHSDNIILCGVPQFQLPQRTPGQTRQARKARFGDTFQRPLRPVRRLLK